MDSVDETQRDQIGHAHDQMQPGVLQDEVFHETADVDDAGHVNVADRRQLLVDAGARTNRTFADLDAADAGGLSKAGVDADDERPGRLPFDPVERFLEIHRMNRMLQRAVQIEMRAAVFGQLRANQGTKRIAGRPVRADAHDGNPAVLRHRRHIVGQSLGEQRTCIRIGMRDLERRFSSNGRLHGIPSANSVLLVYGHRARFILEGHKTGPQGQTGSAAASFQERGRCDVGRVRFHPAGAAGGNVV
ncbi:Putative Recombinational DNA repair protein [Thermobacillus xylanilyticus]|uniref:Recombinational DNA repair protein n=1 Tax=Thermobacillus xylanilyticus TaxID=76633 RepID=A0ABN7RZ19_THEXY|nr:Putative Recombinational DNA repair protein [Thermobacillus xylanilyticus]